MTTNLFNTVKIGKLSLNNRVGVAPMTRTSSEEKRDKQFIELNLA